MSNTNQYITAIQRVLSQGQVFLAHNLATEHLLEFPDNIRLKQLKIVALNRLGLTREAISFIQEHMPVDAQDSESLGLLGRTYKDLYKTTLDTGSLEMAAEAYLKGYQNSGDYYPGINAASMLSFLGKKSIANKIAREVVKSIGIPSDYWSMATLGEAYLLLNNIPSAITHYKNAIEMHARQFGKFQSTLEQLVFLSSRLDIPDELFKLFPKPKLAVFSGHMIDDSASMNPRFPPEIEQMVKQALKRKIDLLNIDIGFSSLASGSDILFTEIMLSRNAELKTYLPFRNEDFIDISVARAGGKWIERYQKCLDTNPKYLTSEPYLDTPDLFRHLGEVMMGECLLLSEQHKTIPYLITVLAPHQIRKSGGTKDLLEFWPFKENYINIDPTQFLEKGQLKRIKYKNTEVEHNKTSKISRKITNVLFADIVGFSKLMAEDTPTIFLDLLKATKDHLSPFTDEIQIINTWGDGIIICHPDVESIINIAFAITNVFNNEMANELNWPNNLSVRIAIHNGPVFFADDPITEKPNVYGTTIIRTARMEPVTLPGAIYASDQFAATLKLASPDNFSFRHVGIIKLPKGYGVQEVYQVTRLVKTNE